MKYPLFKVHIDSEHALDLIKTVLDSGYINEGEQVTEFQEQVKKYLKVENLVLLNSCTSALTVALKLCGLGPGDEVITTAMTCVATNTPIVNLGAKIIWADIDSNTGSISPEDIKRKISPKTKAILYVNWGGTPAQIEEIYEIASQFKILVVQDAAHAFAATWKGKPISDFADFTCFSFQAIKHLSTGDGGALVVKDSERFKLARKLKWFGYDRDEAKDEKGEWRGQRWSADIKPGEVGYKFNMNNIAAAIGISQMKSVDKILSQHRTNAAVYRKVFSNSKQIKNLEIPQEANSSYWVYTCLVNSNSNVRDTLLEKLNLEGIGAGLVHLPNDIYSAFNEFSIELPETRYFEEHQISLPCGWWISEKESEEIATRVLDLLETLK